MYNKILPSLSLDVGPIVESQPTCWLCCRAPATVFCVECAEKVFRVDEKKVPLCHECSERSHRTRTFHDYQPVNPYPNSPELSTTVSMISKMELLSVICIETSHYVCFTQCEGRWLFHDSMADRISECGMHTWLLSKPVFHIN